MLLTVTDNDGLTDTVVTTATVSTVAPNPDQTLASELALVDQLFAVGKIGRGQDFLLKLELAIARAALDRGAIGLAMPLLRRVALQLDAVTRH